MYPNLDLYVLNKTFLSLYDWLIMFFCVIWHLLSYECEESKRLIRKLAGNNVYKKR